VSEPHAVQLPLSLRWETHHHWEALRSEFGGSETTAAVILALVTANGRAISYSRRKAHYELPRRYRSRHYSYRKVVGSVDHLDAMELIWHDRAQPNRRGWQSAMSPKPELIARTKEIVGPRLEISLLPETVWLRNSARELVDYRETVATMRMRRSLSQINEAIRAADISDNLASPMVRIFNNSFGRGGRFYALRGGWQSMKKEVRKLIKISGESVVEIDYKTIHPAILYAEVGAPLPADSYAIKGWPRPLAKAALLILVNASNWQVARMAIAHDEAMGEIAAPGSQEAIAAAGRLISDLKRVHRPIARAFHSDSGARLMTVDSDLAETVMHLMLRKGVPVLPVHDSFLVPESKAELLEEAMLKAAHEAGLAALQFEYS
jgi:hypothetical protein